MCLIYPDGKRQIGYFQDKTWTIDRNGRIEETGMALGPSGHVFYTRMSHIDEVIPHLSPDLICEPRGGE